MSSYRFHNMSTPEQFTNCPDFLSNYLNYLNHFGNQRPSSVLEAFLCLREFCQYVHYTCRFRQEPNAADAHKDLDIQYMPFEEVCTVSPELAERYFGFLELTVKNKSATLRKKMALIRNFYDYITANADELGAPEGFQSPIQDLRVIPEKNCTPTVLSPEEVLRLSNSTFGEHALRDKAIILILATTAITTSELTALNRSDYDSASGTLRISRRNRTENYRLNTSCRKALDDYLLHAERSVDGDCGLFLSARALKRLTPRSIQSRIHKTAVNAGLGGKTITPQVLRETAIVEALKAVPNTQRYSILSYFGIESPRSTLSRFNPLLPCDSKYNDLSLITARSGNPPSYAD